MIVEGLNLADLLGALIGLFLTLSIFSYLVGDNILFRLTIHVFIGVAAGYAGVVAIYNVLLPHLLAPLQSSIRGEMLLSLVPLLLSGLLLMKVSPRLAKWGNVSMAYLVGVGSAAAIGGAVIGTLFPQVSASVNLLDFQAAREAGSNPFFYLFNGSIILVGTISTLAYFHFGVHADPAEVTNRWVWVGRLGLLGQVFIAIAFGVLFAGVYASALMALIERLDFITSFVKDILLALNSL